jgi:hypothetical protein
MKKAGDMKYKFIFQSHSYETKDLPHPGLPRGKQIRLTPPRHSFPEDGNARHITQ